MTLLNSITSHKLSLGHSHWILIQEYCADAVL